MFPFFFSSRLACLDFVGTMALTDIDLIHLQITAIMGILNDNAPCNFLSIFGILFSEGKNPIIFFSLSLYCIPAFFTRGSLHWVGFPHQWRVQRDSISHEINSEGCDWRRNRRVSSHDTQVIQTIQRISICNHLLIQKEQSVLPSHDKRLLADT